MKAPGHLIVNFSRFSSIIFVVSAISLGLLLAVFLVTLQVIDLASALLLGGLAELGITLKWTLYALHAANTNLKQQSDEHRRIDEKLRLTQFSIDRAAVAAFWIKPDAQFLYVNNTACRALGYTYDELRLMTVPEIDVSFPAEQWEEHWSAHWETLKQKRSLTIESRHRRKGGSIFPVEVVINYLQFQGQEFNVAFVHDITERKQAEEALREGGKRYRDLFENANDTLMIATLDGIIASVNRGFQAMTGWSREEVIGQHHRKVGTPASIALVSDLLRCSLAGEKIPPAFEAEFLCKDGRTIPIEGRTRFIRDQEGRPIATQAIYRNITERKRAEEQLRLTQFSIDHAAISICWLGPDGRFL